MRMLVATSLVLGLSAGLALAQGTSSGSGGGTSSGSSAPSSPGAGTSSGSSAPSRAGAPALVPIPSGPVAPPTSNSPPRSGTAVFPPSRVLPPTEGSTQNKAAPGGARSALPGSSGASGTSGDATAPGQDGEGTTAPTAPLDPNAPNPTSQSSGRAPASGGVQAPATRTGKNPANDRLADCMRLWDAGTHMSKTDWARTCKRVDNRLTDLKVDDIDPTRPKSKRTR